MAGADDDRFQIRPEAPKSRAGRRLERFVSEVLKQVSKTGARAAGKRIGRPANTFGRGRVAAAVAGQRLGPNARRVVIKSRFVVLRRASPNSVVVHLRYIERDGVTREGQKGQAYGPETDAADLRAFQERGQSDRHQFRFIVSAEDGMELEDLRDFTRQLMRRVEVDLETRLDWIAVDHWDTDNPHTHIVLNGHTAGAARENLVISPDYVANGMRMRASEVATEWLGPRTEREIRESLQREVGQERWTRLDRLLQVHAQRSLDGVLVLPSAGSPTQPRTLMAGRLQLLATMGLARPEGMDRWRLLPSHESTLSTMGERGEIVRSMQRALGTRVREMKLTAPGASEPAVLGSVIAKGLADELRDRGYLVIDGIDGRAHYVPLPIGMRLDQVATGSIVEVRASTSVRVVDTAIASVVEDGIYRPGRHADLLRSELGPGSGAEESVAVHVRRLEALRRGGLVARLPDGAWRIPNHLVERAREYDDRRSSGLKVAVQTDLPLDRQLNAMGATWLDRQLVGGAKDVEDRGFGADVHEALRQRTNFLIQLGLARRVGARVRLAGDLLGTLRRHDLESAAKGICSESGLPYRPGRDGERVAGTYRRNVVLTSGRFAMLDDGQSFSLIPWKPVLEGRSGQNVSAVLRGTTATWEFGKQRALGL